MLLAHYFLFAARTYPPTPGPVFPALNTMIAMILPSVLAFYHFDTLLESCILFDYYIFFASNNLRYTHRPLDHNGLRNPLSSLSLTLTSVSFALVEHSQAPIHERELAIGRPPRVQKCPTFRVMCIPCRQISLKYVAET